MPVEFISRALAPIYDTQLDFRKASHLLVVGDLRVPRVTLRYDSLGASARLTIDVTPRATATVSQENETLTIRFDADALDAPSPPLPAQAPQSLVQNVRLADPTTLVVQVGPRFAGFKANSEPVDTTMRLEIDVLSTQTEAAPATAATATPELPPALTAPPSHVRTITIDPGHGGADEGVHGANGAKEKDLVLAVVATREGRYRGAPRRPRAADARRRSPGADRRAHGDREQQQGRSVREPSRQRVSSRGHGGRRDVRGGVREGRRRSAASVGGRVPTFGGGSRDIDLVFWDLAQTQHVAQSTTFASIFEQLLHDRIPLATPPIDRAPLRVLESANMPAVLVELGYLTNADQAKLLATDAFQNAVRLSRCSRPSSGSATRCRAGGRDDAHAHGDRRRRCRGGRRARLGAVCRITEARFVHSAAGRAALRRRRRRPGRAARSRRASSTWPRTAST